MLERGERVWCKIISIADDGKIALSMKHVNQGNGKDLDPNGVQLQLDEQKKKQFNPKEPRKAIVLDAVYKTTCSKCKTPGHLAKDCFTTPDGKKYELIPEDDAPIFGTRPRVVEIPSEGKTKEKKHKLKKSKKRKKSKSSKQEDSDSESSDSSDEKSKKKRKKSKLSKQEKLDSEDSDSSDEISRKKRKKSKDQKRKKKKHNSSSSDSDSDSSVSSCENKKRSKKCKHSRVRYSD